jgi:uncharacterized cupin superfamily protein
MRRPIVNINDVEVQRAEAGEHFAVDMAQLSPLVGAEKLGFRLCVVPPGKRAWPYHTHLANEEMVLIIAGTGMLRYAGEEWPIKEGDVASFVPGPENSHQIINSSDSDLRYLCISTMEHPDVVLYPDSDKYGVVAGSAPGGSTTDRTFTIFAKRDAQVPYWEGETERDEWR